MARKQNPHLRITAPILDGAVITELADTLGMPPAYMLRHWLNTLLGFALNQPDGDCSKIGDVTLCEWARWPGTSAYGRAFRKFCTVNGIVENWELIGGNAKRKVVKREQDNARNNGETLHAEKSIDGENPLVVVLKTELPALQGLVNLSPYFDAWREAYGGTMPAYKNVASLRKLIAEYGHEAVLARFKRMLADEKAKFAGSHLLVAGWNSYDAGESAGTTKRKRAAIALHKLLVSSGLFTKSGMMDAIDTLVADGKVRDKEKFVAILRTLDGDVIRTARTPEYAVRHIEERAGSLLD